ncbi:MAG: hypothetical protein COV31_03125 [Candidatus Yanofskybacteria bacterium CG10_big_fil_rev_8_21_14_0_10_46_23]|uniref:Uncharacterized protein n=1 Tax=Candidatus Yanofskybacteria bacterium CG10_big_fil_rev_8_21_14_0_10_46_23 TaxID=1975098 RepID=A0A2H0R3K6_9BACT|nr:MAG: hypothetical protein COV31_03125 [Candidatus Yanofskybacteria bacterium CG10_big_fil_rev_8_21_14_0_10_46_23]
MTKEEILEEFGWIPRNFDLGHFFENGPVLTEDELRLDFDLLSHDPELYSLVRKGRLLALEILFIKISKLEERAEELEKRASCLMFFNLNLMDVLKESAPGKLAHLLIDQGVNEIDPDFSFHKALIERFKREGRWKD